MQLSFKLNIFINMSVYSIWVFDNVNVNLRTNGLLLSTTDSLTISKHSVVVIEIFYRGERCFVPRYLMFCVEIIEMHIYERI